MFAPLGLGVSEKTKGSNARDPFLEARFAFQSVLKNPVAGQIKR
jgi:hypothetical protein